MADLSPESTFVDLAVQIQRHRDTYQQTWGLSDAEMELVDLDDCLTELARVERERMFWKGVLSTADSVRVEAKHLAESLSDRKSSIQSRLRVLRDTGGQV